MTMTSNTPIQADTAVTEINLKELYQTLLTHKFFIIACMLLGLLLAGTYSFFKAPVYQPEALVQVNNKDNSANSSISTLFASTGFSNSLSNQASQAQIQMALIQSSYILQPVINSLALNTSVQPKYFPLIGRYLAAHYQGAVPAPAQWGLSNYAWGGENLTLTSFNVPNADIGKPFTLRVLDSQTYRLSLGDQFILDGEVGKACISQDGKIALQVTALSARTGTDFYLIRYSNVATLNALQNMLQLSELSANQTSTSPLGQDTGIIQISLKNTQAQKAVAILNAVVTLAQNRNTTLKQKQNKKTLTFIQTQIPLTQKALSQAETRLDQYQARNGIVSLDDQAKALLDSINQVETQLVSTEMDKSQLLQSYTHQAPAILALDASEKTLVTQKAKLTQSLANLPLKEQAAIDMMRDVSVYNQLYSLLLQNLQQLEVQNAGVQSDITLLQLASVPDQALPTHQSLIVLAGMLAGLILGCLGVLIRSILKEGISDPYYLERAFGIRTSAIVPYSAPQANNIKRFKAGKLSHIPILSFDSQHDHTLEAIKSLRNGLNLLMTTKQTKVISISGAIPNIGKSFISVNLAASFVQAGKRVLLIDADMRLGYLEQYFGISHAPGLSELLSQVVPLAQVVHQTKHKNLHFIAAGLTPNNPNELLLTEHLSKLLKELETHYDLIIVDTPPILAVSDAALIAKCCGLNLMVLAAGKLQRFELESAIKQFYAQGIVMTGNIFNITSKHAQATAKVSSSSYYNYYHKGSSKN